MKKIITGVAFIWGLFICSCSIAVKESRISDNASSTLASTNHFPQKTVFSIYDEKVTYWIRIRNNFIGVYKTFVVEWFGPDGKSFDKAQTKTTWVTSNVIIGTLPIKGHRPSQMPGAWTVKLYSDNKLLAQGNFFIEDPHKTILFNKSSFPSENVQTPPSGAPVGSSPNKVPSTGIEQELRNIMSK